MESIDTLAGSFKSFNELQEYCNAQFETMKSILLENNKLKDEIKHLKTLLEGSTEVLVKPVVVSPEQAICEMQIEKLQKAAIQRELTLEETKRLDLLIKNLYLSRGQSTQIVKQDINTNYSTDDLLKIASAPEIPLED